MKVDIHVLKRNFLSSVPHSLILFQSANYNETPFLHVLKICVIFQPTKTGSLFQGNRNQETEAHTGLSSACKGKTWDRAATETNTASLLLILSSFFLSVCHHNEGILASAVTTLMHPSRLSYWKIYF